MAIWSVHRVAEAHLVCTAAQEVLHPENTSVHHNEVESIHEDSSVGRGSVAVEVLASSGAMGAHPSQNRSQSSSLPALEHVEDAVACEHIE